MTQSRPTSTANHEHGLEPTGDAADRMFRRLVSTIRARFPHYVEHPFEVAELHQTILPYRHHRQALGLETNEDYEIALLELLVGAHGFMIVDDRMRDSLSKILASPNPDPAALREFAGARVALSPEAVRRLDEAPAPAPQAVPQAQTRPATPGSLARPAQTSTPSTVRKASGREEADALNAPSSASKCQYCDASLPVGRVVTFCPHCGLNVTVVNCTACGTELEIGWKFCTTCGRPTGRG